MSEYDIAFFGKTTVSLIFFISLPVIGFATLAGLVVALLQTMIQLQEQTLGFAVKLTTVIFILASSGGWMSLEMINFFEMIFNKISMGS